MLLGVLVNQISSKRISQIKLDRNKIKKKKKQDQCALKKTKKEEEDEEDSRMTYHGETCSSMKMAEQRRDERR